MTKQLDARQIIAYNKKSIKKMKNIIGETDQKIFESGVNYFK